MSDLLIWLGLPLLLVPLLACPERRRAATAQLILAGLGLAALEQGAGTLDPRDLHAIALQSAGDARFIGLTVGAILTGGWLLPDPRRWQRLLAGVPLAIGLIWALPASAGLAGVIGAATGALPTLVGRLLPPVRPGPADSGAMLSSMAEALNPFAIGAALAVVLLAVIGPTIIAVPALCLLIWFGWWRARESAGERAIPILPVIGTALAVLWLWLVLTIAGSPWIALRSLAADAPISDAAAESLGLLGAGWAIAFAAPWPLDRLARGVVRLIPVAVVLYLAVPLATPMGIGHWQPLLTLMLVLAAMCAVATERLDGAAAALVVLAASRPGSVSLGAALLVGLATLVRRIPGTAQAVRIAGGAGAALAIAVVMRDEVLLAMMLAFGLVVMANRRDVVVAPS